jgi:hypothetical protein
MRLWYTHSSPNIFYNISLLLAQFNTQTTNALDKARKQQINVKKFMIAALGITCKVRIDDKTAKNTVELAEVNATKMEFKKIQATYMFGNQAFNSQSSFPNVLSELPQATSPEPELHLVQLLNPE